MKFFAFLYSVVRNKNTEMWILRQGKDFSVGGNSELVRFKTGNNCKC